MTSKVAVASGLTCAIAFGAAGEFVWREAPGWAAGGMLHPWRRSVDHALLQARAPDSVTFDGEGVKLYGWRMRPRGPRRATVVYLHGVADNRVSGIHAGERLAARGFEVVAYDARASGESGGAACTYGYYEKRDLKRVIDMLPPGPLFLLGNSLGAAIALQASAEDPRVTAVIAVESFSDLRTIAMDRVGWLLPSSMVRRAFARAEAEGHFEIDAVSPVRAAQHITVPVLVIHGTSDWKTRPEHSRRIYDALAGPRTLVIVDGVGHDHSLTQATWRTIDDWMDRVLTDSDH
jgi:uncharacterized protein